MNSGVVMQDGFIFGDTIERNIIGGDLDADHHRLVNALKISNIGDYIKSLPLKLNTKIGAAGNGISGAKSREF